MAVLTSVALASMRRSLIRNWTTAIDFPKPTINAAFQEIEDWYVSNQVSLSASVDTVTSPKAYTNPEKRKILKAWLEYKFGVEG